MSRTIRYKKYECNHKGRDGKQLYKSPLCFKKMRMRSRKAKEKNALRTGKEIPIFKKDNDWNWN